MNLRFDHPVYSSKDNTIPQYSEEERLKDTDLGYASYED